MDLTRPRSWEAEGIVYRAAHRPTRSPTPVPHGAHTLRPAKGCAHGLHLSTNLWLERRHARVARR